MMSDWALDTVECRSGGNFEFWQQCSFKVRKLWAPLKLADVELKCKLSTDLQFPDPQSPNFSPGP